MEKENESRLNLRLPKDLHDTLKRKYPGKVTKTINKHIKDLLDKEDQLVKDCCKCILCKKTYPDISAMYCVPVKESDEDVARQEKKGGTVIRFGVYLFCPICWSNLDKDIKEKYNGFQGMAIDYPLLIKQFPWCWNALDGWVYTSDKLEEMKEHLEKINYIREKS